ncbi:menaquinone biosynthesis decarboxylase [Candidatus Chrysopegis kryptomonas]|uniref:4-hydroxy-3-polyprenylbenzoate decarboxylase n=1 Tax=Candidatus Chryseopegocella kryptomonas TaxID=1633643 RepID=A0A0N7MVL0_9BACT|nr:menaquinone biosynthesis decarboxylase [Candidatus Chrysopegis kryptomonas]CUS96139.1 4-hydroxy-3-polyprenylbenzoate decarboxylase [Candidatus Chrysopegis kryptomonas]
MAKDLRTFLKVLKEKNELKEINTEVSTELEMTEIADRVVKSGGPALLFKNVKNSKFPVVMNLFGTYDRTKLALGIEPEEAFKWLVEILTEKPTPKNIFQKRKYIFKLLKSLKPQIVSKAPVHEVVNLNPNLFEIPALKCWPKDGGKFLTLPLVITHDPETDKRNVGMYRIQIHDEKTAGLHWQSHKTGAYHYWKAEKLNKPLPVAIALGGHPALIFSAVAPLPPNFDELMFASYLLGEKIRLAKAKTIPLLVPADAEFVIEGYALPFERKIEGPFGDHFGYYSLAEPFPVLHITAITHRKDAIYPATIVGKPPMEDAWIGKAISEIFFPFIKMQIPEIEKLHLSIEAGIHNLGIISVESYFPRQAVKAMMGVWGLGQLSLTKILIAVDKSIDPYDLKPVAIEVLKWVDFSQDLIFIRDAHTDTLDVAGPETDHGSKLGIDATPKRERKPFNIEKIDLPELKGKGDIIDETRPVDGILVLKIKKDKPFKAREIANEIWKIDRDKKVRILFIIDEEINIHDKTELLWGLFTRFDPERDIFFDERNLNYRVLPFFGNRIAVDCTRKSTEEGHFKPWLEIIKMDDEIKEKVSEKWAELGL